MNRSLSMSAAVAVLLASTSVTPVAFAATERAPAASTVAAAAFTPVTMTVDPVVVTPDSPYASISGKVVDPNTGEPVPNVWVDMVTDDNGATVDDPYTNEDGTFYASLFLNGNTSEVPVKATVPDDGAGHGPWESETVTVRVERAKLALSAEPSEPKIDAWQPVTVKGKLATSAGVPLVGKTVQLTGRATTPCAFEIPQGEPVTNDKGEYKLSFRLPCAATYTASFPESGYYFPAKSGEVKIAVRQKPSISLKTTLDPYGNFRASGSSTLSNTGQPLHKKTLRLEYSADGRAWKLKKTVSISNGKYSVGFTQKSPGSWRVRFAGDADAQAADSPVVKTWRWGTRMSKISVSPKSVRKNRTVTAKGTLTRYWPSTGRYAGFGGQSVRLVFRYKGGKKWYHVGWAKTDRYGRFSGKVKAYGDGYFKAVFAGSSDTWAIETNTGYVNTY